MKGSSLFLQKGFSVESFEPGEEGSKESVRLLPLIRWGIMNYDYGRNLGGLDLEHCLLDCRLECK